MAETDPKTPDIIQAQTELLRKGKAGDILVRCLDREWRCQSDIITQRCEFFRIAFEGKFKEAKTREIVLEEDPADAVDAMLVHLYTLACPDWNLYNPKRNAIRDTFVIANKYGLLKLRDYACEAMTKLISNATGYMRTHSDDIDAWLIWMWDIWLWQTESSASIKESLLLGLARAAKSVIDNQEFQRFLGSNESFRIAFIRYLAFVNELETPNPRHGSPTVRHASLWQNAKHE